MSEADALRSIRLACEDFRGTLAQHKILQEALLLVERKFAPPPDPQNSAAPLPA